MVHEIRKIEKIEIYIILARSLQVLRVLHNVPFFAVNNFFKFTLWTGQFSMLGKKGEN